MVNFNIIESDYTSEFNMMYSKIKEELSNGVLVKDIKSKYGITDGAWQKYHRELVADGITKPRKKKMKTAKYYTIRNGKYIVQKFRKNKKEYIGSFKSEYDAQKCVKLMKKCDWDFSMKDKIVARVKQESKHQYNMSRKYYANRTV